MIKRFEFCDGQLITEKGVCEISRIIPPMSCNGEWSMGVISNTNEGNKGFLVKGTKEQLECDFRALNVFMDSCEPESKQKKERVVVGHFLVPPGKKYFKPIKIKKGDA